LTSELHLASIHELFQNDSATKLKNKLSTKLAFWLLDKEIAKRADDIVQKQTEEAKKVRIPEELSSVAKGKIRYLAGACVQRITKRVKESVLRTIGKCSKKSRTVQETGHAEKLPCK
jgi:hypothetical protein